MENNTDDTDYIDYAEYAGKMLYVKANDTANLLEFPVNALQFNITLRDLIADVGIDIQLESKEPIYLFRFSISFIETFD